MIHKETTREEKGLQIQVWSVPSTDTSVGNWTDGGQLFYPAIWPAPFCQNGSTSKQPRQGAQECVQVPWAAFSNILKAVPSLENQNALAVAYLWVKIYKLKFFCIFFPREGSQISEAKLRFYWRKINLCPPTVLHSYNPMPWTGFKKEIQTFTRRRTLFRMLWTELFLQGDLPYPNL